MMTNQMMVVAPLMGMWVLFTSLWLILLVWGIIDIARSKMDPLTKLFWLLIITMVGNFRYSLIGLIIYYFVGRKSRSIK